LSRPVDIRELVALLAARAPELCQAVFPAGVREGREWRVGSLAGEAGRSLAVHLGGERAGIWADFASGECGDALDLVAQAMCRADKAEAIKWARSWLGLDGNDAAALERSLAARRRQAEAPPAPADGGDRRDGAFRLWLAAQEKLAGTPVDRYLAGRGIELAGLGRQPRSLRYHPSLWNGESRRAWPAMLAGVVDAKGNTVAVHRTWLEARPDLTVRKAPLADPKMTLGSYKGGCIRLWRGASGKQLADAPAEAVAITEGIEDGLSVAVARPDLRVLVAVALANMAALELPPQLSPVILCAQQDGANAATAKALDRAIARFLGERRRVQLAWTKGAKDMNELLCRGRGAGAA
jgi:hypothetical protein